MKIDKVGISAKNLLESVTFYKMLGFEFDPFQDSDQHVETTNTQGAKLMLDTEDLLFKLNGESTKPSNASAFAVEIETPEKLNEIAGVLKKSGYTFQKEPWDAFWGQRYAIVIDPSGYLIDLYAYITPKI